MAGREQLTAWRPPVPGIAEILHATFVDHAYPAHVHEAWTLLIVDSGAIRYDLDRHQHSADPACVTLLPPGVVHNGRTATPNGFRKRVIYLDRDVLGEALVGPSADRPTLDDADLRRGVHRLHLTLAEPGNGFQAESQLALIGDRLRLHLRHPAPPSHHRGSLAGDFRDLLDAHLVGGLTLRAAATVLGADPSHLVRIFTARFGVPPHAYLTGRRVDRARRLLLTGQPASAVAVAVGFYDQAHLTRHFKRYLGTTPAQYAADRGHSGVLDGDGGSSITGRRPLRVRPIAVTRNPQSPSP